MPDMNQPPNPPLLKSESEALSAMRKFQKEQPGLSDSAAASLTAAAAIISLSYQVSRLTALMEFSQRGDGG